MYSYYVIQGSHVMTVVGTSLQFVAERFRNADILKKSDLSVRLLRKHNTEKIEK